MANLFSGTLNNLTVWLIHASNLPYISFTNVGQVLSSPLAVIGLIFIAILLLLFIAFIYAVMINGFAWMQQGEKYTTLSLIKKSFFDIQRIGIPSIVAVMLIVVISVPFTTVGFQIPLLSRLKIPEFVVQDLSQKYLWFVILLIILWFVFLYILLRTFYVISSLIIEKTTLKTAFSKSLELTKGTKIFRLIYNIVVPMIFLYVVSLILYTGMYLWQFQLDNTTDNTTAKTYAYIFIAIIAFVKMITAAISTMIIFWLSTLPFKSKDKAENFNRQWNYPVNIFLILASFLFGFNFLFNNDDFLDDANIQKNVLMISHRGVDEENGVQNTIPAMLDTNKKVHPDYVEIDIRWTKDHQWVVMHDANVANLSGKNLTVADSNFEQLVGLELHENDRTAKLPSFDEYLQAAQSVNQKLLVEIKYEGNEPTPQVDDFLKKYQSIIQDNNYRMHSLDSKVVSEIRQKAPNIQIGFIMPFNLAGDPQNPAQTFTVEYSTMSRDFIEQIHDIKKKVYVWTVNSPDDAVIQYNLGVDGIISDDLTSIKEGLTNKKSKSYSDRLYDYLISQ